jgi:hypothetical protein
MRLRQIPIRIEIMIDEEFDEFVIVIVIVILKRENVVGNIFISYRLFFSRKE